MQKGSGQPLGNTKPGGLRAGEGPVTVVVVAVCSTVQPIACSTGRFACMRCTHLRHLDIFHSTESLKNITAHVLRAASR